MQRQLTVSRVLHRSFYTDAVPGKNERSAFDKSSENS